MFHFSVLDGVHSRHNYFYFEIKHELICVDI